MSAVDSGYAAMRFGLRWTVRLSISFEGALAHIDNQIGGRQWKQTMVCPDVSIISAHQAILFNVHLPSLYALHFVKIQKKISLSWSGTTLYV